MPRFEPKIDPFVGPAENIDTWCRRNVAENLARFKSEYMRRLDACEEAASTILNDMLPDPPAAPVNDDARDAARFRWLCQHHGCFVRSADGWYVTTGLVGVETMHTYGTLVEAIDAAMERDGK